MRKETKIMLIEDKSLRFLELNDDLYFSALDVIKILNTNPSPRQYWGSLKKREPYLFGWREEKMIAKDGRQRLTVVVNLKGVLQMIWCIKSPISESFKHSFAQAVTKFWEATNNLDYLYTKYLITIYETYRAEGYSDEWIQNKIEKVHSKKEFIDLWKTKMP